MRLRLILSFTMIVLVSVTSLVLIARQSSANEVRAFMFRGGMSGTETLVSDLEIYYQENGSSEGADTLLNFPRHQQERRSANGGGPGSGSGQGMVGGMMNQRLRLADPQGRVVVDTSNSSASSVSGPGPDQRLTSAELERAIALQARGETVGYLLPEGNAQFTRRDELALVNRLTRAAIMAGLVAGSLALLLALLLSARLLRPVHALTLAAKRLEKGDLSQRVDIRSRDELSSLGNAFNRMATALQQAEKSRQAMTADIAHELRTPLTVQRAQIEALQDGIYPASPENLASLLEQNLLLERLVEDLRTLALVDGGQLHLELTPTDLGRLIEKLLDRYRPQADSRQVALTLTAHGPCPPVPVDPGRLEQILGNLLSNALRYTPAGGSVTLSLNCSGGLLELTVHDSGPGIPPDSLDHVFERFYRADRSRSRAEGGTGLGLAIARQLAEAHLGTLHAANHPDGGALFTLRLPLPRKTKIAL
jgi:two-component system OmpR family sensor kinase/two-component system sensor histidine kinase BaeS